MAFPFSRAPQKEGRRRSLFPVAVGRRDGDVPFFPRVGEAGKLTFPSSREPRKQGR